MVQMANFSSFYQGWLSRQEDLLRQLEALLSPVDGFDRKRECGDIIPRVIEHYREFYREKAAAVEEDVFVSISPPWMSSFERSLLWITGFRPSILFPIMDGALAEELSPGQMQRMEEVKTESRRREREITQDMARVQETVAEQPVYSLVKRFRNSVDYSVPEMHAAIDELKAAMRAVVGNADALQGWTVAEMVEVLDPVQGVRFLAAVARFQLRARNWGVERDA
ncbi:protein RESPONSE TO ABA AND SALT 1-like [Salvia miltiorrhiza]|uniref:protein RESPONSE TO ABA AND SALT 1-like n=1 Tax=Salvia miltiorrhiza TaxID=226208 RepID=UPI0025AD5329|nr:protein RESPONSE TO ABA AND SALT 1-like [Salvia miltiorrhiza]